MKFVRSSILTALMSALASAFALHAAHAVEFKSIGAAPAILYDAPSVRGKKVFVAPRNMPVEVVFTYSEWSKIRDVSGDLSWVESKQLSAKRSVVVTAPNGKIHAAAEESSAIVFTADKGVLLDIAEPLVSGWIKIKHSDGQSGFIKITDVWGV